LPREEQPESKQTAEAAPQLHRQLVAYATTEPAGTIIIDTAHTFPRRIAGNGPFRIIYVNPEDDPTKGMASNNNQLTPTGAFNSRGGGADLSARIATNWELTLTPFGNST
jgi:hypothetical protein